MKLQHLTLGGDDGHTPVVTDDFSAAIMRQVAEQNRVNGTTLPGVWVSTVFIGGLVNEDELDLSQVYAFETLIQVEEWRTDLIHLHQSTERYQTWDQAARGHDALVARVRSSTPPYVTPSQLLGDSGANKLGGSPND